MPSVLMDALLVCLLVSATAVSGATRMFCDRARMPLELGEWTRDLVHMDTATIDNPAVSVREGQIYVYENDFPNRSIKYIHVDNLAVRTCGAGASIKSGGINDSFVFIVLHAGPQHEIRSVIDIWGTNAAAPVDSSKRRHFISSAEVKHMKKLKSKYLSNGRRTVNHNFRNNSYFFK